jgi:REP element-mobilizing transposase RayT
MRLKSDSFYPGSYYHLYNHAAQNTLLYRDDEDYEKCLSLVKLHLSSSDFSVVSFCLMPNHYHFLIRQNSECPVFYPMNRIWFSYSKYYNKRYQGMGSIFAGRLQHILIDKEIYLHRLIVYIHLNPVSVNEVKKLVLLR